MKVRSIALTYDTKTIGLSKRKRNVIIVFVTMNGLSVEGLLDKLSEPLGE